MADLMPSERGQLLLVGGIVVAFVIVGVAVVLNTVVFADAIESRDPPQGIDSAQEHASAVQRATARLVVHEEKTESADWDTARTDVGTGVADIGELLRNRTLHEDSAYTEVSISSTRRGAALVQTDETRDFTSDGGGSTWRLATTTGIRNYKMRIESANTDATDEESIDPDGGIPGFTVTVTGNDGVTWEAYVTHDQGNSSVRVVTRHGTEEPKIACRSETTTASIDWTDGTVDGKECDFTFARELSGPYTLEYDDGGQAQGEYHLVVSDSADEDDVATGNFGDANPRQYPAVYSLVLTAVYEGPAVARNTDIRVAPGEPPETSPA